MGTALPSFVRAGDQTFRRASGPGFDSVRSELQLIDPNLDLFIPEFDPFAWACLWNGPDGQWHAVCVNRSGDPQQLAMLPRIMRERDGASPTNSRESAWERDMRRVEERKQQAEVEAVAALSEAGMEVYTQLRKDIGHHFGVTKQRYFQVDRSKDKPKIAPKRSNVDAWD